MPNIKSSKKAVKVIAKKTDNNHELKMRVQNLIKNCEKAIAATNKEEADKLLKDIQKYTDKAVLKTENYYLAYSHAQKQLKEIDQAILYLS